MYVCMYIYIYAPVRLSKIGKSDHFAIKSSVGACDLKTVHKSIWRRDLRESSMNAFGRWITRFNWSCVTDLTLAKDKFQAFCTIMSNAVDLYLPKKRVRVCPNNKPWVTPKLTSLIRLRQNVLSTLGKDSNRFKHLRNRVQRECKTARARFSNN